MRVGLLADIHGNSAALAATLAAASREGVERLLCAGDCIGYYYDPATCLDLLADWDVVCVRGNHEDLLTELMRQPALADDLHRRYGSALAQAASSLSARHLAYLESLPARADLVIGGRRILLCHGSPWDPDLYVYPDAESSTFDRCAGYGADVVVMGHTHYRLTTTAGTTTIVNPGSVGQPRDRRPGAAWALLDTGTGACVAFSEAYDTAPLEAQARAIDPHLPYLHEVLCRQ